VAGGTPQGAAGDDGSPRRKTRSQFGDQEHTSLGKPITARILRAYAFRDPHAATVSRNHAIRAAIASGWHMNPERIDPLGPYYGSKKLSPGPATLAIGKFPSDGVVKVSILLDQGACPRELCGQ
jgi:hypothetical protein